MNRADTLERNSLVNMITEYGETIKVLQQENETLKRRVAELEAQRRPTNAVSTKTLRVADVKT